MTELEDAKHYWANNHSQSARVMPEGQGQDHRYELARHILTYQPESVLEFGCNSGRNLFVLNQLAHYRIQEIVGMDMHTTSIDTARAASKSHNIAFWKGDEVSLSKIEDNRFDVVFTCSVLDHIPEPTWKSVYADLVRVAKMAVVLLEPMYASQEYFESPYEGDLSKLRSSEFSNGMRVVPFTYSWDYVKHDPAIQILRRLPIPTDAQDSGEYYWLMERRK